MYLLQINEDGLVMDDKTNDSWKGISIFRDVVKKYKIQGLTVVALTADYASPLNNYHNDSERFIRAVETVYYSRDKLKKDQLIIDALNMYESLQFNADLEQDKIIKSYKSSLLKRIRLATQDESEVGEKEVERLNKALASYEKSNVAFYESFNKNEIINTTSITSNGYILSRIENDLLKKKNKSKFANEGKGFVNPNTLNLENQE